MNTLKVQQAASLVKEIIPYSSGKLLDFFKQQQDLLIKTSDFQVIAFRLPLIKRLAEEHQQIITALLTGSPNIEVTYHYYRSGESHKDFKQIDSNALNKMFTKMLHNSSNLFW